MIFSVRSVENELAANGPAINVVSVAERMEAGVVSPHRVRVPLPAVMREPWRTFCLPKAIGSKNRDKQLTFIVRVRFSLLFFH